MNLMFFYYGTILENPTGLGMNINVLPEDQVFASELRIRFMTGNLLMKNETTTEPDTSICDTGLMQFLNPDRRHIASWEQCKTPVYVIEQLIVGAPILVRQKQLRTKTSFKMSEPLLQGWIDNFPRLTAMIAQKNPFTGLSFLPSGSYSYEAAWPTPFSMQMYGLDFLGFGKEVEKYMEPYRLNQGEKKPPSPYLNKHPGYFGSPPELSAIDWITNNAAILWAAANHALMSGNKQFIEKWTQPIDMACCFICGAVEVKVPGFYTGILPPAVSNDSGWCSQSVWNNASKKLEEYRNRFREVFRKEVEKSRKWKDVDGCLHPLISAVLSGGTGTEVCHAFYLDTGPLVLVFGELFDADEQEMISAMKWFRKRLKRRIYRRFSSEWQPFVLDHEISSCEPCFSWNIFHSLQIEDREKFTTGLYSLFAAGASRQNFVSCETINGVSGNCFSHILAFILTRLCVIQENEKDLHLLKMVLLAFLADGGFRWKNVATYFGDISISAKFQDKRLFIDYKSPDRISPQNTFFYIPPANVKEIHINSKKMKYSGKKFSIFNRRELETCDYWLQTRTYL